MSKLTFLVGYNNYFNRKIKFLSTLEAYEAEPGAISFQSLNFNPADGVSTQHVINWDVKDSPDYLVVSDNNEIVSRWFVIEWVRNRKDQYTATLKRDVVADNFESVIKSPCFIERGPISAENKLIYNSEGMNLNQIKQEEIRLYEESGLIGTKRTDPWIVGYIARSDGPDIMPDMSTEIYSELVEQNTYSSTYDLGITLKDESNINAGGVIKTVADRITVGYLNLRWNNGLGNSVQGFKTSVSNTGVITDQGWARVDNAGTDGYKGEIYNRIGRSDSTTFNYINTAWYNAFVNDPVVAQRFNTDTLTMLSTVKNYATVANYNKVVNGLIVRHTDGQYYRLTITSDKTESAYLNVNSSGDTAAIYTDLNSIFGYMMNNTPNIDDYITNLSSAREPHFRITCNVSEKQIVFTKIEAPGTIHFKFSTKDARNHLTDAPYDMFCLKFSPANLSLAQNIATKLGDNLYDLQILPYYPGPGVPELLIGQVEHRDFDYIKQTNVETETTTNAGKLYYCTRSSRSFIIRDTLTLPDRDSDNATNIKLANECDMYRLTAPNYSSSFEFSVAKNGGVSGFKVSYTYRPIAPYIHVQPIFSNMYGN